MQINNNYLPIQLIYFLDNCIIVNLRARLVEWGISIPIFHINICFTILDQVGTNLYITIPGLDNNTPAIRMINLTNTK